MKKNENGITLVTLVIVIVVMIVITGISISIILSDNETPDVLSNKINNEINITNNNNEVE